MAERLTESHPGARPYLPGSAHCPQTFDLSLDKQGEGIGGYVSDRSTDFFVHEQPKYHPSGEGDHCMALVLKEDRTTEEAISSIVAASGLASADVGYAGRKDKRALTTQWFSFPCAPEQVHSDDPLVQVICAAPHHQKLRLGHNRGNLFVIRVSEINTAAALADELSRIERGIPNYFGLQRFGHAWYERRPEEGYSPPLNDEGIPQQDPDNLARDNVDRALMFLERFNDVRAFRRLKGKQKRDVKLSLSALQSALFNLWIGERIRDGLADQVIEGDVCRKTEGGTFYSTDPALDTQRLLRGEITVLGPMVGPKLFPARALAREREERLYSTWGLTAERRSGLAKAWRGDRRPMRLAPQYLSAQLETLEDQRNLILRFCLPSGSFATTLLGALINPKLSKFARRSALEVDKET